MLAIIDTSGSDALTPYLVTSATLLKKERVTDVVNAIERAKEKLFPARDPTLTEIKTTELLAPSILKYLDTYMRLKPHQIDSAERAWASKIARRESLKGDELAVNAKKRLTYAQALVAAMKDADVKIVAVMANKENLGRRRRHLGPHYKFLFERIFHAVRGIGAQQRRAVLVFDDEDDATLKRITHQIRDWFRNTDEGYARSEVIVPVPFYVRSSITPLISLPDLVSYCLAWGWRGMPGLDEPARENLQHFAADMEDLAADCGIWRNDQGKEGTRRPIDYVKNP